MVRCDECKYREIMGQNKYCCWHSAYIGWHGCENGERNPVTNADRIRAMTEEELAEWLDNVCKSAYDEGYTKETSEPLMSPYPSIASEWLDWLKQEAE